MFRPSRPMMRPFMSSDGSATIEIHRLHRVVGGEALDGGGEHFLGLGVRRLAGLFLEAHAHELRLAPGLDLRPGPLS